MRSVRCPIAVSETRGEVAESYGLEGVADKLPGGLGGLLGGGD